MSSSIDEQFIEYIVKSLVSNPEAVKVERSVDEKGVLLELTVDPEDLGRVIGKRGATAQSLRTLLRALGTKNDARYNLKIVDNGVPKPERAERSEDTDHEEASKETRKTSVASELNVEEDDDETEDEGESSSLSKTRKELADLDDLDL
jgi:uncharacterized protein